MNVVDINLLDTGTDLADSVNIIRVSVNNDTVLVKDNQNNSVIVSSNNSELTVDGSVNLLKIRTTAYEDIVYTALNNHSLLTNLSADDHQQYLNIARGDARYYTKSEIDTTVNRTITTISDSSYTVTSITQENYYYCNTSTNSINITLPTAVGNTSIYNFKKIAAANTLTVTGFNAQTIDGGLTAAWTVKDESLTLISDNSNWRII